MQHIINQSNGSVVASTVLLANSFWKRLKGLLGHKFLNTEQALVLTPCTSVHSCFMRFTIDVVFVDEQDKVIHLQENFIPWRFSPVIYKAKAVIELSAGSIKEKNITLGDTLRFCD